MSCLSQDVIRLNDVLNMGIYLVPVSIWSSDPTLVIRRAGKNMRTHMEDTLLAEEPSSSLNWAAMTP